MLFFFFVLVKENIRKDILVCSCVRRVCLSLSFSESRILIGVGRRFVVFYVTEECVSELNDYYLLFIFVVDLELKKIYYIFFLDYFR